MSFKKCSKKKLKEIKKETLKIKEVFCKMRLESSTVVPVFGSGYGERYSKYHLINFLDNLQVLVFFFFVFFCVRRSIYALYPENQPGFGSVKIRIGS